MCIIQKCALFWIEYYKTVIHNLGEQLPFDEANFTLRRIKVLQLAFTRAGSSGGSSIQINEATLSFSRQR